MRINNNKLKYIFDFFYSLSSNLFSMVVSSILVFILPRYLSVFDYGMWQLYIFYTNFVHYMPCGWLEGMYLRFVGSKFYELDIKLIRSQFRLFLVFALIINALIFTVVYKTSFDMNLKAMISYIVVSSQLILMTDFFKFLFRYSDRIKEYSLTVFYERLSLCLLCIILLILDYKDYSYYLFADITSKIIVSLYLARIASEILFGNIYSLELNKKELFINLNIGSKLLLGNAFAFVSIAIIRYVISTQWGVSAFGKVSMMLSISMFLSVFINSISIIIIPILRKMDFDLICEKYQLFNRILSSLCLFGLLNFYFFELIIIKWLPKYSDAIQYMIILFPCIISTCKIDILVTPLLKSLRKENALFFLNLTILLLILFMTRVIIILNSMVFAVMMLTITYFVKQLIYEWYTFKLLRLSYNRDFVIEIIYIASFLYMNHYKLYIAPYAYLIMVMFLMYKNKKSFIECYRFIRY